MVDYDERGGLCWTLPSHGEEFGCVCLWQAGEERGFVLKLHVSNLVKERSRGVLIKNGLTKIVDRRFAADPDEIALIVGHDPTERERPSEGREKINHGG